MSDDALSRVADFGRNLDRDAEIPAIEKLAGLYPRGFMSIVAAQAGTGKTWFMQYIACRLSMGGNILSGLVPKSKRYKSLIMAGETGTDMLNLRMKATCWDYDKKRVRIYNAVDMQMADIPIMLNTPEGRATFVAILENEKPDVVFFDTLISFHTADESKQGEMTSIYTYLLKLAMTFNCAVVVNHHTRKKSTKSQNSAYTQDDVIGTNAGVRLANNVFLLVDSAKMPGNLMQEDNEGMPTITVSNVKSWDKRIPDFTYSFVRDPASDKLDFAISWDTSDTNLQRSTRERMQLLIESMEAGAILSPEMVSSQLMTSKNNARNYLEEFTRKGKLETVTVMNKTAWKVI